MLSVVIASTGRSESLKNTLQSLSECDAPKCFWELFVIVNGNDQISLKVAETFSSSLPIRITFLKSFGKNKAINSVMGNVKNGLVLFTDDDIRFDGQWLRAWELYMRPAEDLIIRSGPSELDVDSLISQKLEALKLDESFLFSKTVDFTKRPISAELCWGGNLAIPATFFQRGFRFNEAIGPDGTSTYRMGSEVEFCLRLERDGFQCQFVSEPKVFHRVRPSQLAESSISERYFRAGRSAFLFRQFNEKRIRFPFDVMKGLFFLKLKLLLHRGYATEHQRRNLNFSYAFLKGQIYEYFFSRWALR